MVDEMLSLLAGWQNSGRPTGEHLRLRVFGADFPVTATAGEALVQKRWVKLLVDWPH